MSRNKNTDSVVLHGEAMIISRKSIPSNLKPVDLKGQNRFIIADSETTGNHHVVGLHSGVSIFRDDSGKYFATASEPFEVSCVLKDRHSSTTLPAGNYEFGIQKEYDPFEARMRAVRD